MSEEKDDAKAQNEDKSQKEGKQEKSTKEVKEEKKEEPKKELVKKEKKEKKAPSGKFKDLIKQIEELSVMELADLVAELEDRFGVSAAAPVAVAGVPAAGEAGGEEKEEKSSLTIHLTDAGSQKIAVIKAVRVILPDLGLKEAKDLVDAAPKEVKKDVPKAEAEEAKKKLEEAGAKVELK